MEQSQKYSPLEIIFVLLEILSRCVLFFCILVWIITMILSSRFGGLGIYGMGIGIMTAVSVLAKERRYYTRKENFSLILMGGAVSCTYFLNHSGIFPIGSALIVLGGLCNIAVISANGFYMPVAEHACHIIKTQKNYFLYTFHNSETKLKFLSDIITLGEFITISVGDIALVLGRLVMYGETLWWLFFG